MGRLGSAFCRFSVSFFAFPHKMPIFALAFQYGKQAMAVLAAMLALCLWRMAARWLIFVCLRPFFFVLGVDFGLIF